VIHASSGLTGSSRNQVARRGGDPVRSAAEMLAGGPWSSMVVVLGPCCHARPRTKALSGLSTIFPSGRAAQPPAGLAARPPAPPRPGVTGHAARHGIRGGPGPAPAWLVTSDAARQLSPADRKKEGCHDLTTHPPSGIRRRTPPGRPGQPRPSGCCGRVPAARRLAWRQRPGRRRARNADRAVGRHLPLVHRAAARRRQRHHHGPGRRAVAVGAAALASPRGFPGLQFGSLLLGAWLIISPFVLDEKFPIAHPMYWSNSWSGGVLMALALASLAVLPRPAR